MNSIFKVVPHGSMSLKCLKQLFFSLSPFCDTICSPAEGIEIPDAQVISRALVSLHTFLLNG